MYSTTYANVGMAKRGLNVAGFMLGPDCKINFEIILTYIFAFCQQGP